MSSDIKKFQQIMCSMCGTQRCLGREDDIWDCLKRVVTRSNNAMLDNVKKTERQSVLKPWICPKCENALSPYTSSCSCI